MTRWAPQKKDVLAALSDEILHNYGRGRVVVAVDGTNLEEAARFADDLAAAMRLSGHTVFRASTEGFHRPRAERFARGRDSPEASYRDSYDYLTFQRSLIQPFRMGGSTGFVPAAAVLIVDGSFLNRPELRGLWNYSVWLDAADDSRSGGAHELYARESSPRTTATAIVANSDPDHPRRVFADSC
jgi:uridine kinase